MQQTSRELALRIEIKCERCGKSFIRNSFRQRFCGSAVQKTGCSYRVNMEMGQKAHKLRSRREDSIHSYNLDELNIIFPPGIFDHKVYPLCKCGRRFVPINKGDKECFWCNFTKK